MPCGRGLTHFDSGKFLGGRRFLSRAELDGGSRGKRHNVTSVPHARVLVE